MVIEGIPALLVGLSVAIAMAIVFAIIFGVANVLLAGGFALPFAAVGVHMLAENG